MNNIFYQRHNIDRYVEKFMYDITPLPDSWHHYAKLFINTFELFIHTLNIFSTYVFEAKVFFKSFW